jgi:hypothetical protein
MYSSLRRSVRAAPEALSGFGNASRGEAANGGVRTSGEIGASRSGSPLGQSCATKERCCSHAGKHNLSRGLGRLGADLWRRVLRVWSVEQLAGAQNAAHNAVTRDMRTAQASAERAAITRTDRPAGSRAFVPLGGTILARFSSECSQSNIFPQSANSCRIGATELNRRSVPGGYFCWLHFRQIGQQP